MSSLSIRLPHFLHHAIKELAHKEHISLNQFISLAVAEKLSALTTKDYLVERAKWGDRKKFLDLLDTAPNVEPEDFDKI